MQSLHPFLYILYAFVHSDHWIHCLFPRVRALRAFHFGFISSIISPADVLQDIRFIKQPLTRSCKQSNYNNILFLRVLAFLTINANIHFMHVRVFSAIESLFVSRVLAIEVFHQLVYFPRSCIRCIWIVSSCAIVQSEIGKE